MSELRRSDRARYAAQVFYRNFNDVDIFIEDTAVETKKIYINLLKRVLGDAVSFSQIFPIGDKNRVYQRCASDQGERSRPAVYIVDGDHDELLDQPKPIMRRLYKLDRYCVENYLFDGDAAASYLDDEVVDRSREQIESSLNFENWLAGISSHLVRQVQAVIVAHRKGCADGLPRANWPLTKLCSTDDGEVDCALVDAILHSCKERVDRKHGAGSFEAERSLVSRHFCCLDTTATLKFVSGKTVLLPLLRRRIKGLFGISANEALFRLRLSKVCDVSELERIRGHIC